MSIDTDYDEFLDEVFLENDRLRKEVQDLKKDFITTVSHRAIVNAIKEERDQLKSQNAEQAKEIELLRTPGRWPHYRCASCGNIPIWNTEIPFLDQIAKARARVGELEAALKELCDKIEHFADDRKFMTLEPIGFNEVRATVTFARQALESGGK